MGELVRYEVVDAVGTITLDSPHNRNALSRQLVGELLEHLVESAEDACQVVVLRSQDRVFCSGADLSEASEDGMEEGARAMVEMQRRVLAHPKPVITRIGGPVRAGGLGLVGASDVVVCAEEVTFAFTESRLGLAPAVISLSTIPRLTSRAASDTFLSGRSFTAREAVEMGLVTRCVAGDRLDEAVGDVVNDLLQAHPQGLAETKRLLNADLLANLDARAEEMAELSARLFGSEAAKEAMTAFLNRRRR